MLDIMNQQDMVLTGFGDLCDGLVSRASVGILAEFPRTDGTQGASLRSNGAVTGQLLAASYDPGMSKDQLIAWLRGTSLARYEDADCSCTEWTIESLRCMAIRNMPETLWILRFAPVAAGTPSWAAFSWTYATLLEARLCQRKLRGSLTERSAPPALCQAMT